MAACSIDHSKEDVIKKLESQKGFLPEDLYKKAALYLEEEHSQQVLNELFHLLKKYDLATNEEQQERDLAMENLLQI